jgi:hypothetical protein
LQPHSAGRRFPAARSAWVDLALGRGRSDAALELVLSDPQAEDQGAHQQQRHSKQQEECADAHVNWFQGHRQVPALLAEPVSRRATRTGTLPLVAPLP